MLSIYRPPSRTISPRRWFRVADRSSDGMMIRLLTADLEGAQAGRGYPLNGSSQPHRSHGVDGTRAVSAHVAGRTCGSGRMGECSSMMICERLLNQGVCCTSSGPAASPGYSSPAGGTVMEMGDGDVAYRPALPAPLSRVPCCCSCSHSPCRVHTRPYTVRNTNDDYSLLGSVSLSLHAPA